jgi:hypothetical protein
MNETRYGQVCPEKTETLLEDKSDLISLPLQCTTSNWLVKIEDPKDIPLISELCDS